MDRRIHEVVVRGVDVDSQTRCGHWHSEQDIIAIKFKCCLQWYPCFECHAAVADHPADVWPSGQFSENAVFCGACGHQLTIDEYLNCGSMCPACRAAFNPGCSKHLDLYFEMTDREIQ